MKILKLKTKIVIAVVLFITIIGAGYSAMNSRTTLKVDSEGKKEIGNITYKGQFPMPVENFKVVTSKYGARIHPITRQEKFPFRN